MASVVNLTILESSFVMTNTVVSFVVYDVLLVLICITCFGKFAPCSTIYHCCISKSSHRASALWKKSKKTQCLVGIELQVFAAYIFFRVLEHVQDIICYSFTFVSIDYTISFNWFLARNIIELIGYYVFVLLYTLFVSIYLKSSLFWIRKKEIRILILVFCNIIFVCFAMIQLALTIVAIALCLYDLNIYLLFVTYGFGLGLVLYIISLTLFSFAISFSLIFIITKSVCSKAKIASKFHKLEQQMVVFKLIIASLFFFLSNVVWIFGLLLYGFNLYYYIILLIRVIPDALIMCGIFCVFWPFRLLPQCCFVKQTKNQSKVTQFIRNVAEVYDIEDEYDDTTTDTSTSTTTMSSTNAIQSQVNELSTDSMVTTPTSALDLQEKQPIVPVLL